MSATGARPITGDNRRMLVKLSIVASLMFGFGYAMVPFYKQICLALGLNSLVPVAVATSENTQVDYSRKISMEFDANVQRLDWTFKPVESYRDIHPGEVAQVVYEIRNTLDRPVTGQAAPTYGPSDAAQYFKKIECFCFTKQTLAAGETRRMPVVFLIDPKLPADVKTITLSYTFFEVAGMGGKS